MLKVTFNRIKVIIFENLPNNQLEIYRSIIANIGWNVNSLKGYNKENHKSVERLWEDLLKDNPKNKRIEIPLSFYFYDNKKTLMNVLN